MHVSQRLSYSSSQTPGLGQMPPREFMSDSAAKRGMRLDTSLEFTSDVTLVAVRVTNDASRAQRVRIANRLDGPVWPPRVGGRPAPGWDDGGYEGVLDAGETRSLGYATPSDHGPDPNHHEDTTPNPVEIAWVEDAPNGPSDEPPSPGVVMAELGDPRPPRDVLPESSGLTEIPSDVRAWLDRVETRVAEGTATPADRETLDRVVGRANDLRRAGWSL